MEALLSHCVRSDGERLDPALSPAPSVLAEDGRGTLYALGADGVIRASPARHVNAAVRGAIDADAAATLTPGGGVRAAVHAFRPSPAVDFEPRVVSVSPSGHFAAVGGLRHAKTASPAPPSSALSIVTLRTPGLAADTRLGPDPDPDPDAAPGCRRVAILEEEFERHPSVRVLRAAWHPSSDGHLVVLLSDGTLRVFDAAAGPSAEQAFRLDPWGRGPNPGPYPLRPEIVDFAFAPPHGWGALSLILLGREGDAYTMCPFTPWGARYPRVTMQSLTPPDAAAERWLDATFPTLRGDGGRRLGLGLDDDEDEDEDGDDGDGDGDGDEDRDRDEGFSDSDDDGRGRGTFGGDDDDAWTGGTIAARPAMLDGLAPGLRGPLPLGTDPVEGDDGSGGGGVLGRGVVARALAAAPFAAGEGGGALLAVAHQRASAAAAAADDAAAGGVVSATLDVLILPREPAPGWAHLSAEDEAAAVRASELNGGPPVVLAALVTDDDEGALPPLLAIDRVQLASAEAAAPLARSVAAAAANELAPFVSVQWDPASRERLFCCAGGAVHAVTLTWLSAVEGAVDDEDGDGGDDDEPTKGSGSEGELSLPAVVTLMDSREALLGVAPVGDPLAEGLLLAVDAAGRSFGLHPAPPLPADGGDAGADAAAAEDAASAASAASAAAEASAELRALAGGPGGAPPAPPADAAGLRPGTAEGNAALAAAVASLRERHLRYAHRVHAATRRHSVRLGAELRRQRAEAAAIREGLEAVAARRENLRARLARSRALHEDIRARLRKLAELERTLPHPLTRAEFALRTTLRANEDDVPLLRAKMDELRRRAEEVKDVRTDPEPSAALAAAAAADPAIRAELAAQDAAIRANRERLRRVEAGRRDAR